MTSLTLNRSAIMARAGEIYRAITRNTVSASKAMVRLYKSDALREAWAEAKNPPVPVTPQVQATREAILAVECKNTLTQRDYARLGVLRAALRAHEEHAENVPAYAEKRQLIESAEGRFCAVTFTKKDGTERVMQVQPATLKSHVKGDRATDAGKQAVATRKATHPNLLPVWDAKAKAPRSINLATVSRIAVDGAVHEYVAR